MSRESSFRGRRRGRSGGHPRAPVRPMQRATLPGRRSGEHNAIAPDRSPARLPILVAWCPTPSPAGSRDTWPPCKRWPRPRWPRSTASAHWRSTTSASARATSIWSSWPTTGPTAAELARLAGAARGLRHAGRPAQVWYVDLGRPRPDGPGFSAGWGCDCAAVERCEPAGDADDAGHPPPRPDGVVRSGLAGGRLRRRHLSGLELPPGCEALVASAHGTLIFRRDVAPLVLEAARLTQAVITGRVLSKSEAGELAMPIVSTRHQRLLTDAVGYRHGAHFSMYWGPFERKYDALTLLRELLRRGHLGPVLVLRADRRRRPIGRPLLARCVPSMRPPRSLLARSVPS